MTHAPGSVGSQVLFLLMAGLGALKPRLVVVDT